MVMDMTATLHESIGAWRKCGSTAQLCIILNIN